MKTRTVVGGGEDGPLLLGGVRESNARIINGTKKQKGLSNNDSA